MADMDYWGDMADQYSDGCDEDSDASGTAPTGCRTRVDFSSPWHYTLALRVLADSSIQIQQMAYPTFIYSDLFINDDEECFPCTFCAFPAGTAEDRTVHEGRCLSLLARLHRLQFDLDRRAGRRRRRGKDSRTASAPRPEGDPPSSGPTNTDGTTTTVVYPLGADTPYYQPRTTDPRTTNRRAASPRLPNPPLPSPARCPNRLI